MVSMMKPLNGEITERAFEFCSSIDVRNFFIPSQISLFMNRIQNIALWESVYVHETIHSILGDCLTGWWIQIIEEIANNMFVVFRSGEVLDKRLVSWIINLEYKIRKLCKSWVQTQEGFATYFQLNIADVESRAVTTAKDLHKMGHPIMKEVKVDEIKSEVEEIKKKWMHRLTSKNCPEPYWRGYELVAKIADKFGEDNLAPVALAACSVRFSPSLISQSVVDFQKTLSQEKYNVDKRLELISQIPKQVIRNFPLKDDWINLTQAILNYIGEPPLEEFNLVKMTKAAYTNPAFPKEFINISEKEMQSQIPASEDRWKLLKKKGIDSSQLVAFFNINGDLLTISDFEPAYGPEIDYISALRYRSILNSLDRMEFINDLLICMAKKNKVETWMEELWGFAGYKKFREIFSTEKMNSLEKICCLCLEYLTYSNRGILCPYSGLLICMRCCSEMKCNGCREFSTKKKVNSEINRIIRIFTYNR